ncbi:MAG: FtsX-like permease family protein [Acidobacteria bacterium]|nr:FtsX-like permease family protein [Acidobacteriota bacterium]MYK88243.1 FtsX-like permease family protein [Acidobacteriota bacterium]
MQVLLRDVRYAIRRQLHQRGTSIVEALTLALGIGASTAIFSVIDAAMLRPLPYPDPEELVRVGVEITQPDGRSSQPTPSMADMRLWQQADAVFSAVAGWGRAFRGQILDGPEPARIEVSQFSEAYLSMHGVTPLFGRDFTREDTDFGAPAVALLGYGYWQSRYAGRRDVIGETLRLDDGVATIVGVLPASFEANIPLARPLRIPPDEVTQRGTGRVTVLARLRPGVTVDQASADLSARMAGEPLPDGSGQRTRVSVSSRLESTLSRYRTTVTIIASGVGLILLLACVNVAGLLLARGAGRQSELALRAALGAGRPRLIRQLLTESLVLALTGGAAGVFLAWLSLDALVAHIPISLPVDTPVTLNLRVLAATVALLVLTVLLFGLAPALSLSRVRIGPALASGGRQPGPSLTRRGGQVLVATEVALAVVLVVAAGLMLRSFARLAAVDLGFNADGLITMEVLPLHRDPAAHKAYYTDLVQRARTLPGVASAGLVDNFPLGDETSFTSLRGGGGEPVFVSVFGALPGYFETIDVVLRAGRLPTDADLASGLQRAVINEAAARALFPDGPAVGQRVSRAASEDPASWNVLGVIGDLRHGGPLGRRSENYPQVFLPLEPTEFDLNQAMVLVLRPSARAPDLGNRLREAARSIGPRVLVERVRTGNDWFGDRLVTPRRRTVLLSLLGGLGLVLALVGVFGMTAYAVERRTSEIGLRMALGARPGQVVSTMVRNSAVPIVIGTGAGLGGAALTTRVIQSFLFETTPTDAATFTAVALASVAVGCLAALVPAIRATRVDPVATLRAE